MLSINSEKLNLGQARRADRKTDGEKRARNKIGRKSLKSHETAKSDISRPNDFNSLRGVWRNKIASQAKLIVSQAKSPDSLSELRRHHTHREFRADRSLRRCPIIAASTPPSLRAQRSNPGATARGPWIASSQGLLAMTVNGGVRVPQVDFLISGLRPRRLIGDVAPRRGNFSCLQTLEIPQNGIGIATSESVRSPAPAAYARPSSQRFSTRQATE